MTITIDDARPFVRRMFAAFNRQATEPMTDEIAEVMVEAACSSCAITVLDRLRREGRLRPDERPMTSRMPTAFEIRAAVRDAGSEAEHARHVGIGPREDNAQTIEAFWRQHAVRLIRPYAQDEDTARVIAACLWWADVAADMDAVVWEMEVHRRTWIDGTGEWAGAFATVKGITMAELSERAFARARHRHVHGEDDMPTWMVDLEAASA